jgi:DNA-binding NarL/FixJ family response regulator
MTYKISILDDHPMVIEGLTEILEGNTHYQLANSYKTIHELKLGFHDNVPDILLLDLQLPDGKGTYLADELIRKFPQLKIIVITSLDNLYLVKEMLSRGCRGYLVKSESRKDDVLQALEKVVQGGVYLPLSIHKELMEDIIQNEIKSKNQKVFLSMREKQIIKLICLENTSHEIAEKLSISKHTVDVHRKNIVKKLNITNMAQLYDAAQKLGII